MDELKEPYKNLSKPCNNFEMLKNMTITEFAAWCAEHVQCLMCPVKVFDECTVKSIKDCEYFWVEWLETKQESRR